MNRLLKLCIVMGLMGAASGCYTMNAALPGTLRTDIKPDQTEKVGNLSYETTHWYFIYGLVGAPPEDVFATEIKKQVQARGADGVANLRYEAKDGCLDLVITGCTAYCITPRTYTISGDIVRIKTAPLPGSPAKAAAAATPTGEQPAQHVAQGY